MSDTPLKRVCMGDAVLSEKIATMDRGELEMLAASLVVVGRKLDHRAQLDAYEQKICDRAQSTLITSLTPLDDTFLQLVEECAEQGYSHAPGV
jgi:hypothetical protein